MDERAIVDFFNAISATSRLRWSEPEVRTLAGLKVPEGIFNRREWLIQADATLAHARWFIDGLVDPAPFVHDESRNTRVHLLDKIYRAVRSLDAGLRSEDLRQVAAALTDVAWRDIEDRRIRSRTTWPRALKQRLWHANGPVPRCYLCGYKFSEAAMRRFLHISSAPVPTPPFVDFFRPRVSERHVRIEIDHVQPLAGGGSNDDANLRLACGWCNAVKGRFNSLYDAFAWTDRTFHHPILNWISIPRPMWILRIVSMRGKCEHVACTATLATNELFATPWCADGAITPTSIAVYCEEHDSWKGHRLVGAHLVPKR
jgi:hypothetical protein